MDASVLQGDLAALLSPMGYLDGVVMNQNIQRKYERVNSLIFPGCLFQSIIFQLLSRTIEDEPGKQ
jgi:hypothetical protein